MIEGIFNQTNYSTAKKLLDSTALRQEAIASNLANLETPGYKRLEVNPNFEMQLKQALASGNQTQMESLTPTLSVDTKSISERKDGNTVHLEAELLQMNQNMMEHALETQLVSASLMKMRMAITGKA
ncbi:MAG: flagellar basal-body rod protein FlgB [Verrucomicrobiales bacterium]|nr:flagellar basal-body rod protein FlgB [Verrucomicrobiales bacterium]MDB6131146.1 flagellar basal-body rod protein FlgB [Verrucomicrobiales bacterium]